MSTLNVFAPAKLSDQIDSLASNLKHAAEYLASAAAAFKDKAADAKSHAVSRAGSVAAKAGKSARKHPFLAVAAAGAVVGAGYLVMRLARR
jgi:ElaB/YqjD/DUF883 family membrane-anchored ribosome-binding protein